MPKSAGGLIAWAISSLVIVAVGLFVLSRIAPIWRILVVPRA